MGPIHTTINIQSGNRVMSNMYRATLQSDQFISDRFKVADDVAAAVLRQPTLAVIAKGNRLRFFGTD